METERVCWEGGLQKWQAVILNQTWNKLFLGTYFFVDQRYVKYMYLYKYKVTLKFWCYVCCQILCLKNKNKITFLLPMTCRITTIVFYLWVKPPLCIFHWNEESALGYFLQTWCITKPCRNLSENIIWLISACRLVIYPFVGLRHEMTHLVDYWAKLDFWGDYWLSCRAESYHLKTFCEHLASSQLWQSWLWSFQTSFLFQEVIPFATQRREIRFCFHGLIARPIDHIDHGGT